MYKIAIFISALLWATAGIAADTIAGTVHNETTGQPSAGDEVVLLRLGQGMQQESRTTTDAQGAFTLNVLSAKDQHLVQVSHQGVTYNQPVTGTGPVDVIVYNAVTNIPGLAGSIGYAKLDAGGKVLWVTEMYVIANRSNPPVTQSKPDNFEITVPEEAAFDSAQVKSGKGIWVKVALAPLKGQKGKYGINFPIRPGDTLFSYTYHLPYQGSTTLHLKVPYPIEKFGVMHPSTMSFKSLRPNTFQSGSVSPGLQGEALTTPALGDVPAFEISGMGQAPEHGTQAAVAPQPSVSAPPPPPRSNAHPAPAKPPAATDQSSKETWLMIAGIVAILVIGFLTFWRMRVRPLPVMVGAKPNAQTPLLDSLKEELFQLESNRVHGSISAEEYATTKQALTESIQRAMARNP